MDSKATLAFLTKLASEPQVPGVDKKGGGGSKGLHAELHLAKFKISNEAAQVIFLLYYWRYLFFIYFPLEIVHLKVLF